MLHLRIGDLDAADSLVRQFHYSRRMPANIQFCATWHEEGGLFGDYGEAVAACLFSIPPTRWSEDVLELSRLVRRDQAKVTLTGLIAAVCNFMRQKKAAHLLVSFADATQGHHGGIYQAASWLYAGQRERNCDGVLKDGVFIPGRSCNSTWGTRSPEKLRSILPNNRIEPHFDEGKHLYWRALTKIGRQMARRLELAALPYPKPMADYRTDPCNQPENIR